jgi:hypothetical protein
MKNRLSYNIETAWKNIQKEVETSDVILILSEKTLVFKCSRRSIWTPPPVTCGQ